jgi:hypothetical protein
MNPSRAYDPTLHADGSAAASGTCSYHQDGHDHDTCTGDAVVSFQDAGGEWQSGCAAALRELVAAGRIEPLGQGA